MPVLVGKHTVTLHTTSYADFKISMMRFISPLGHSNINKLIIYDGSLYYKNKHLGHIETH